MIDPEEDSAHEAYSEALGDHMAGACDPLTCPWCHGEDPDVGEFESRE